MQFLVLTLFVAAGLAITFYGWRSKAMSAAAVSWPSTEGSIVSVEFDDAQDGSSTTSYQTNIKYAYTVRGTRYESSRIAFGYSASISRTSEYAFFNSLKAASSLRVRYNPVRPAEATLDCWPGEPRGSGLIGFGLLWLSATLVFIVIGVLGY
jgi:Protein of unknown function (DUF3592)